MTKTELQLFNSLLLRQPRPIKRLLESFSIRSALWCPVPEIACLSPQVSWLFFKARATSISEWIREERATRKNSQLDAAQRVAMKMGWAAALLVGYVSI